MHAHTAEIVEIHGCQCQRIWPEAAEINDSADKKQSLTQVELK